MHRWWSSALMMIVLASVAPQPAFSGEIHQAVTAGDVARVAELIRANPDLVNERDTNQTRDLPLHTAAVQGNIEIARLLLDAGAELDGGDSDNSTPLHVACLQRHPEMVAFLLERGADVHRRDMNAAYALSFAASGGDTAVVRLILRAGADLWHRDRSGLSLLHYAARGGLEELTDSLLARDEDVNARTFNGDTPLMWAVSRSQVAIARKLLTHGARPDIGNHDGETPLHRAAQRGNLDMGRLLLAWGANPNAGTGAGWNPTPLFYTCWDGHDEFARLLIANGANVNQQAGEDTPLYMAVERGHADLVAALLEGGAGVDFREAALGFTALHMAAVRGYRDIAELLVQHGATVTSKNLRGETPIQLAARYGHGDVVGFLVAHGAGDAPASTARDLASFASLPEKEAAIWFLGHSGWAVKTRNHLLIFDYFEGQRPPAEPALCNGHIAPAELAGESVTVFASHSHADHYSQRIWEWQAGLPHVSYVLGFQPEGEVPAHEFIGPRETRTVDGMQVTTIEANDSGVGFLVEVDGLTILHPGDHANRTRDFSTPFKSEIDWLDEKGVRPDIAFFPIAGCGFGDQEAVKLGVYYALETLQPRVFIPMHAGDLNLRPAQFVEECRASFPDTRMETALGRGDRFLFRKGNVSALASRVD